MRKSRFERDFDRTSNMISFVFVFIIFIKVMMLCLIVYGVCWIFTTDLTLDGIGHAIGSFIGSIEKGMNQ